LQSNLLLPPTLTMARTKQTNRKRPGKGLVAAAKTAAVAAAAAEAEAEAAPAPVMTAEEFFNQTLQRSVPTGEKLDDVQAANPVSIVSFFLIC
jgi:hypothetical protein